MKLVIATLVLCASVFASHHNETDGAVEKAEQLIKKTEDKKPELKAENLTEKAQEKVQNLKEKAKDLKVNL